LLDGLGQFAEFPIRPALLGDVPDDGQDQVRVEPGDPEIEEPLLSLYDQAVGVLLHLPGGQAVLVQPQMNRHFVGGKDIVQMGSDDGLFGQGQGAESRSPGEIPDAPVPVHHHHQVRESFDEGLELFVCLPGFPVRLEQLEGHLDGCVQDRGVGVLDHVPVGGDLLGLLHHLRGGVAGQEEDGDVAGFQDELRRLGAVHAPAQVDIHQDQVEIVPFPDPRHGRLPCEGCLHGVAQAGQGGFFGQGDESLVFHEKDCFSSRRVHGRILGSILP